MIAANATTYSIENASIEGKIVTIAILLVVGAIILFIANQK
jgi:hypothetical protein